MKQFILVAFFVLPLRLFSQEKAMFDSMPVNDHSRLIGRFSEFDKDKRDRNWNFFLDDAELIRQALKELTLGEEVTNTIEDRSFRVSIIQDYREVRSWTVNPTLKSALYNGHTYLFDTEKIKSLGRRYPFQSRLDTIVFKNMEEYKAYFEKQKANTNFIYASGISFDMEGDFEIEFPRNNRFSSPKAISDYLEPRIEKIVKPKKYYISYSLSDKNMKNMNQFTMTITGSRQLFEKLDAGKFKKENWQPIIHMGWFYYRVR